MGSMNFNRISDETATKLEQPISDLECLNALKGLAQNKAPGPDGFQVMIIRKCWPFTKEDIMRVVRDFNKWGTMNWRLKSTFISLIPKKNVVEEIRDFRPIGLMNSIYKMISKVLAERLKQVLPTVISHQQSAFIKGRQILDCALLVNECIDSKIRSRKPRVIFKIGFEKAFDHVSWEFVDEMLERMVFGTLRRKWIHGCITDTPIPVLIYGSANENFTTGKGLTQGDPLFPFVFLIVSEALNLLLQTGNEQGYLGGFSMSQSGVNISHLQFADDTLVFLDDSIKQMNFLRFYLLGFQILSGLHINFSKCSIFCVAGAVNLDPMERMLGCNPEVFPSSYLGLPLGDSLMGAQKWESIIDRIKNRLPLLETFKPL